MTHKDPPDYPSLFDTPLPPVVDPHARNTDPYTSHLAAADVKARARAHRLLLLDAYVMHDTPRGLTDAEAGQLSGVTAAGADAWKRCSDLRNDGYIEPTGERADGGRGSLANLCRVTDAGREAHYGGAA